MNKRERDSLNAAVVRAIRLRKPLYHKYDGVIRKADSGFCELYILFCAEDGYVKTVPVASVRLRKGDFPDGSD